MTTRKIFINVAVKRNGRLSYRKLVCICLISPMCERVRRSCVRELPSLYARPARRFSRDTRGVLLCCLSTHTNRSPTIPDVLPTQTTNFPTFQEMRTTGFKDLDGKVIVSALPPQHPGAGGSGGGGGAAGRGKPSVSHKRQLSSRLAASFRARGAGRGGGVGQDGEEEMEATTAAATPTRGGADSTSPKKDSLSRKTSPATARSLSMTSGLSSNGSGSGLSSGPSFDTAETSSGEGSTFSTGSAKPPLGRRSLGRPTPVSSSSSRPPRTVHQPCGGSSTDTCQLKQQQQHNHHHHQHSLGAFSARWAGASRARKTAGGGAMAGGCKNGLGSSPASPVKGRMCNGSRSATPFSAAATSRRAFSLR